MVAAARYDLTLDQPVRTWQGALLLSGSIEQARSILVTVHGYRTDGELVEYEGRHWYRSAHLEAGFHYLSPGTIGSVVPMDAVTHEEPVIRLCLVARPFAATTRPVPELVSTLCFQDLEPLNSQGPTVISAHTMEVIDV